MSLVRRVARPLLATMFVVGGLDALRRPADRVEAAAPLVDKAAEPMGLPNDPELLVRANGAAMVVGGAMLATGRMPRVAATVLAASLVPSTMVEHPFWSETDPERKANARAHFLKNLGLLGGVLLAAVDTEGQPGLAYRAKLATESMGRQARLARREAKHAAAMAGKEASLTMAKAGNALG